MRLQYQALNALNSIGVEFARFMSEGQRLDPGVQAYAGRTKT